MSISYITCRTGYSSGEAHFQLQMHCGISGGDVFAAVRDGCYLSACLKAGGRHAITMLGQKQVICSGLVNFCHKLILCHGCSEATQRKRGQGTFIRCASKSGSFFHDKASAWTFYFLDAKGKWRRAQKEGGKVGRKALHPLMLFHVAVVGHHHFQSFCPLTGVLPLLKGKLWLPGAHYLRHNSSQWSELPREKGTG